jgi:hypothetical protein
MTTLLAPAPDPAPTAAPPRRAVVLPDGLRGHLPSLAVLLPLLVLVGIVHGVNVAGWPGPVNGDEGIYVSQAWAVEYRHTLSHYEYWYDHPPLGWLVMALYAWLTFGFERTDSALLVGREIMLLTHLVSAALLFQLARRVHLSRVAAAGAVVLFSLSPLALHYQRMVFLDNLSIGWLLAALVFAASERRSLGSAVGAGICFACAVLTKETTALLFPVLVWLLLQHSGERLRKWRLTVCCCLTFSLGLFYPLYAALKNELFTGPGHVSLQGSLVWQLHGRVGSGSLLDPTSGTYALVSGWLERDPWVLVGGVAVVPLALASRRLRPFAAGLALLVTMMCRGGYVPYPYVIGLLPFCALLVAGCLDAGWRLGGPGAGARSALRHAVATLSRVAVLVTVGAFVLAATLPWARSWQTATTTDSTGPLRDTTSWVTTHVPRDAVIVVDDYHWPELVLRGYTNPVLFTKVDLDPAVQRRPLSRGWESVDYVVLPHLDDATMRELPTVATAIRNSVVVATFGDDEFVVRQVVKPAGG